jgi:hypothetical protein
MKNETNEEIVEYFENDPHDFDKTIFQIAKQIEVAGLPYTGAALYIRNGETLPREEWWKRLTVDQKAERLTQAKGAWDAIQSIGVEIVLQQTFESYLAEK